MQMRASINSNDAEPVSSAQLVLLHIERVLTSCDPMGKPIEGQGSPCFQEKKEPIRRCEQSR